MNFKEWIISEFYFTDVGDGYGNPVKIYKNSSTYEATTLLNKSDFGDMKGVFIEDNGDVYIWNGGSGIHSNIVSKMVQEAIIPEPKKYMRFYLERDENGQLFLDDYYREMKPFMNHPNIQRMVQSNVQTAVA